MRYLSLFLIFAMLASGQSSLAAFHEDQALDAEVTFNQPGLRGAASTTIEDKLVSLIHQAIPGSKIRMAMYGFSRPAIANALKDASVRGVDVRVVLDGSDAPRFSQNNVAVATLQTIQCSEEPCVRFCHAFDYPLKVSHNVFGGSCRGVVINHNKFFLFSALNTGDMNIVAQTSSNFDDEQMHMANDLVQIKNDKHLFAGYDAYWESLKPEHISLTAFRDAVGDSPVIGKFFPRILTGADPIMHMLKRVNCRVPGSVIRVTAPNFTRDDVAARLRDLADQGCDVEVIADVETSMWSPSKGVQKRIGNAMIVLPYKGPTRAEKSPNAVHAKLVLIDAALDNDNFKTAIVMTGSHNLDFFSLRTNDETLLEIKDRRLFELYMNFWNQLQDEAHELGLQEVGDVRDAN